MVIHNPIIRSVVVVSTFWWVVLTGWAVGSHYQFFLSGTGVVASLRYTSMALIWLMIGVALGVVSVVWRQILLRIERDEALVGQGRLGMLCTLGEMPVQTEHGLSVDGDVPAWFWDGGQIAYGPQLKKWIDSHADKYPAHVTALEAVIKVFCQYPDLPASHVPNGHGGKSLVDHSARVTGLALTEAKTFKYAGLVTKYGSEPWADPGYDFDPFDPLIPVIAMAHDIGKLITFQMDRKGKVVSSRPNHDTIGSRMLATMTSIKALPAADQAALHRAISFYHHPSEYPMNMEGRIGDDRSVALMMLLIKADKRAGKEEAGKSLSSKDYAAYLRYMADLGQELDGDEQAAIKAQDTEQVGARVVGGRVISDEEMKAALERLLTDPTLILAGNPQGSAYKAAFGQVNNTSYPKWAWDWKASGEEFDVDAANRLSESIERLIVVNEPKFRLALAKRLGLSTLDKKGDGRYLITIHALRVLATMGVLYTDTDDGFISPESALYVADIVRNTDGSRLANWRGAIVLRPVAALDRFATGPLHPSLVNITRPLWKDRLVKGEDGVSELGAVEYAGDEMVLDEATSVDPSAQDADCAPPGGDEYSLSTYDADSFSDAPMAEDESVVVHDDTEVQSSAVEPATPAIDLDRNFPPLFTRPGMREMLDKVDASVSVAPTPPTIPSQTSPDTSPVVATPATLQQQPGAVDAAEQSAASIAMENFINPKTMTARFSDELRKEKIRTKPPRRPGFGS